MSGPHPSHRLRFSMSASSYDEICEKCGATDQVPGGWGLLAFPCPVSDEPSIVCPRCGARSYHPKDIQEKYCGNCHKFHGDP